MIEHVKLQLELSTENPEVVDDPIGKLAEILQRELIDRLKLGADYGNIQDNQGNKIGSWNIFWIRFRLFEGLDTFTSEASICTVSC